MAWVVSASLSGQAWVARPNQALTPTLVRCLLLGVAGVSGGIALAFTAVGAWPVMPFAGIELGALWLALRHLQRHAGDEERIEAGPDQILVTRIQAGHTEHHEFSRYWARLHVVRAPGGNNCRLFLRSHGRELEIGRLLTEAQKRVLARDLTAFLGA